MQEILIKDVKSFDFLQQKKHILLFVFFLLRKGKGYIYLKGKRITKVL